MIVLHQEFVIDKTGKKRSVLLPYEEWIKVIDDLEELDDIREFDKVKTTSSDSIPFEDAIREIKQGL